MHIIILIITFAIIAFLMHMKVTLKNGKKRYEKLQATGNEMKSSIIITSPITVRNYSPELSLNEIQGKLLEQVIESGQTQQNLEYMLLSSKLSDAIGELFLLRNSLGMAEEKSNNVEEAIRLYELNIRDGFEGTHPYMALINIYQKANRISDAERIMLAYRKVDPNAQDIRSPKRAKRKAG